MINERDVVERVERFLRQVAEKVGASGVVISKDGYFFYFDGSDEPAWYEDTKRIVDENPDIFNSMLSSVERLFSDAICAAVEDVRKAYFQKYPNALLYLNGRGILVTRNGNWDEAENKDGLFEIVREVL